jgi:protein SCO1/2
LIVQPRFQIIAAAVLLTLVLVGAALMVFSRDGAQPHGDETLQTAMKAGVFDPPQSAPDFSLRGSDGADVTLERYRGKVVLMTFGFTYCAAVCPTTLATLAQARESLGADAAAVQVIFVTVDPARDDVAHMRDYLASFGDGFVGATGAETALAAVREGYGVTAVKQGDGPDYAMAHTSSIFLIDREGQLRGIMPFGHDPSDFVHDIRFLLRD